MATPSLQGTVRLPLTTLTTLIGQSRRIVGLSVTPCSHEVVSVGPPCFQSPYTLHAGSMLTPEQLLKLVTEQEAGALVVGGTGLFRADGTTHYGVRKLISGVMGVTYQHGDWLPRKQSHHHEMTPILLCREGVDDAAAMLTRYVQRHAGHSFPGLARQGSL